MVIRKYEGGLWLSLSMGMFGGVFGGVWWSYLHVWRQEQVRYSPAVAVITFGSSSRYN